MYPLFKVSKIPPLKLGKVNQHYLDFDCILIMFILFFHYNLTFHLVPILIYVGQRVYLFMFLYI